MQQRRTGFTPSSAITPIFDRLKKVGYRGGPRPGWSYRAALRNRKFDRPAVGNRTKQWYADREARLAAAKEAAQ